MYVPNRRGRGGSGPHGADYSLEREREDLLAVQAAAAATVVFGHSYGGLVVLHTLTQPNPFVAASVYEPGVSINKSIPVDWLPNYRAALAKGNRYAAFAHFIQGNPQAPPIARIMPLWYLSVAMRAMPGFDEHIGAHLEGNALEHEQVDRMDGRWEDYRNVTAPIQFLVGARSPRFVSDTAQRLQTLIPKASTHALRGLGHRAPTSRHAVKVAGATAAFLGHFTA